MVASFTNCIFPLGTATLRSPRKSAAVNGDSDAPKQRPVSIAALPRSPQKQQQPLKRTTSQVELKTTAEKPTKVTIENQAHHRFELALQESKVDAANCVVCEKAVVAGSPFWKCKECKDVTHRKCRSNVQSHCGSTKPTAPSADDLSSIQSVSSLTLDSVDVAGGTTSGGEYIGSLVYSSDGAEDQARKEIEVNCAFEVAEQQILLLGCNTGLYAYHLDSQRLVHISGLESVSCMSICKRLAKAIMVGTVGEKLYQCDYRQLESRCQSSSSCHKPVLETSAIELPFANRTPSEKWKLVLISDEAENALDSVAIAATSTRIVILKYDLKLHMFKPVRALDTATPVTSIFFTRHSAIVSSDKFYEIDLDNYAAEEFVDLSDKSMESTAKCQPLTAVRISRQEYLLCFAEYGVFVDEFGCRSRPYDLNWVYAPTGFVYRDPFLFISHYQSVQIVRLHRSFSKEMASGDNASENSESPELQRVYLPHYMSTLLANSGDVNLYAVAIDQRPCNGTQKIYHLDTMQAFKQKFNISMETLSSVATSVTLGSTVTGNSI